MPKPRKILQGASIKVSRVTYEKIYEGPERRSHKERRVGQKERRKTDRRIGLYRVLQEKDIGRQIKPEWLEEVKRTRSAWSYFRDHETGKIFHVGYDPQRKVFVWSSTRREGSIIRDRREKESSWPRRLRFKDRRSTKGKITRVVKKKK